MADDPRVAAQAARVLGRGTADTQPEILGDLESSPPKLGEALRRLQALDRMLASPADAPNPSRAARELRRILALPRYHSVEPPWVRIRDAALSWLSQRFQDLLRPRGILDYLKVLAVVAVLVGVVVMLLRGYTRLGREVRLSQATARGETAVDYFAEADRLAAADDYAAAIRALTAAVCVALLTHGSGWEHSPLTVRELFMRSGEMSRLGPLLLSFEAAVYGHHRPDRRAYRRAAEAAARFRPHASELAA